LYDAQLVNILNSTIQLIEYKEKNPHSNLHYKIAIRFNLRFAKSPITFLQYKWVTQQVMP